MRDPLTENPAEAPDVDGEFTLAPPQGKTVEEITGNEIDGKLPLPDQDRERIEQAIGQHGRRQFSILELMALMTFVAIYLSAARWLRIDVFVFFTGVVLLACLVLVTVRPSSSRIINMSWIVLLLMYAVGAIVAIFSTSSST